MSLKQNFNGGIHHHNYNLTQAELNLETKETCSFRTTPKFRDRIQKRADEDGLSFSKHVEITLYKYYKIEPLLKQTYFNLDDILKKI